MGVVNVMISSSTGVAPDLLTVEEAARVLRIGRTSAYALACRYLRSNGAEGIPVRRVGHLLRVPRHGLEELVGGPITWPIPDEASDVEQPNTCDRDRHRTRSDRRPRPRPSQQPLPLPS